MIRGSGPYAAEISQLKEDVKTFSEKVNLSAIST
jgi:hypothetical protein